jgi:hypothetical protein
MRTKARRLMAYLKWLYYERPVGYAMDKVRAREFAGALPGVCMVKKLWQQIKGYRPSWMEAFAIILCADMTFFYLWAADYSWQSVLGVPLMLVFGYLSVDMLYDLWFAKAPGHDNG